MQRQSYINALPMLPTDQWNRIIATEITRWDYHFIVLWVKSFDLHSKKRLYENKTSLKSRSKTTDKTPYKKSSAKHSRYRGKHFQSNITSIIHDEIKTKLTVFDPLLFRIHKRCFYRHQIDFAWTIENMCHHLLLFLVWLCF